MAGSGRHGSPLRIAVGAIGGAALGAALFPGVFGAQLFVAGVGALAGWLG